MTKITHRLVKQPQITVPLLADYMAASEQRKRSIVRDCKYRRIARIVQHSEAKVVISNFVRSGSEDTAKLVERAASIDNKLAADEFEQNVNHHNADYVRQFAKVFHLLKLPDADILPAKSVDKLDIGGVKVTHSPNLRLRRLTRTNKLKSGAIMFRYAKGKELSEEVAIQQSAAIFGFTKIKEDEEAAEAERSLCLTVDAYSGNVFDAPGRSVYLFNQMKAACASIAERWPAIQPPKNAVL